MVSSGSTLILPANGQIALQEWAGKGYIDYKLQGGSISIGMIIGGDYFGGYGAIKAPVEVPPVASHVDTLSMPSATTRVIPSLDPVDMASGAFLSDNVDLAMAGGMGGLAMKRSYTSANNTVIGPLGHGWAHGYNLYAEGHSNSEIGLGRRQPVDAAAILTTAAVTLDLMGGTPDVKAWTISALIGKWGMDRLTGNAVSVHLENSVLTYVKLPDGTFTLPPGVTANLTLNGGLYRITERFGRTVEFNGDRKVSRITDADGNAVTFTYSGQKLASVADGFGHTLTFAYTGANIIFINI